MSIERKVKRNQAKREYKEYFKGIKKKERSMKFSHFWKPFKYENEEEK